MQRSTLLLRERTLLTESLLYAVILRQRLPAADTVALVEIAHGLALRTRGTGAGAALAVVGHGALSTAHCQASHIASSNAPAQS